MANIHDFYTIISNKFINYRFVSYLLESRSLMALGLAVGRLERCFERVDFELGNSLEVSAAGTLLDAEHSGFVESRNFAGLEIEAD